MDDPQSHGIATPRKKGSSFYNRQMIPRRGLSRLEAATYIGISITKFDELVAAGRMPKPKKIDRRRLWDLFELDVFFDALGESADDSWVDFHETPFRRT
jgi:hypothetical protein